MAADVSAVIVAGGSGTRFGNPDGKQLMNVAGRPLMSWCLEAFDRAPSIGVIVVVCPAERTKRVQNLAVEPFGITTPIVFAASGETRQDSSRAGLDATPEAMRYVAVHDGARPLISVETIERVVAVLRDDPTLDGAVCGQPSVDTLKVVEDGVIARTPDRARFWTVQTPQVFSANALRRAYEIADGRGFVGTDDASLVERAGGRIRVVESPRDNLKVTLPEDLVPIEAMLRARE